MRTLAPQPRSRDSELSRVRRIINGRGAKRLAYSSPGKVGAVQKRLLALL